MCSQTTVNYAIGFDFLEVEIALSRITSSPNNTGLLQSVAIVCNHQISCNCAITAHENQGSLIVQLKRVPFSFPE